MFEGNFEVKINKNRLELPARIARNIKESEKTICAVVRDSFVDCYPKSIWDNIPNKEDVSYFGMPILRGNSFNNDKLVQRHTRLYSSKFSELKSKDGYVLVAGCCYKFEVWNIEKYLSGKDEFSEEVENLENHEFYRLLSPIS